MSRGGGGAYGRGTFINKTIISPHVRPGVIRKGQATLLWGPEATRKVVRSAGALSIELCVVLAMWMWLGSPLFSL